MILEPEAESRPWAEQFALDDANYRRQVGYLFKHSAFYRQKLGQAGLPDAAAVGGLAAIGGLPFTEKAELRQSASEANPVGAHLCAPGEKIVRIYSTSGTTGTPSYIPLTRADVATWQESSMRSYASAGVRAGEGTITTYNAGPFAAGAALGALERIGACHIPLGTGNTERLLLAIRLLRPTTLVTTPSYAAHLAETAAARGIDLRGSSISRLVVGGEPGGGEAALRARLEDAWGAKVREIMGIGDIGVSLWGECEHQCGMHLGGRGNVHAELIEPTTGATIAMTDGAQGELVLTHLRHEAAPLLRFRTRDHVAVWTGPCGCGRTAPRVRCIGRTDDMLIVRGVNVFPSAVREVVAEFAPLVSGHLLVKPGAPGVKQEPPLAVVVELARTEAAPPQGLAERIGARLRSVLVFSAAVELVPFGALARSEYKTKLVQH